MSELHVICAAKFLFVILKMSEISNISKLFPWITSDFVQKVIEKSEKSKDVILESFTTKKCFNDGENFSSYMIGLNVFFQKSVENGEKQVCSSNFLLKIAIQTEEYAKIEKECLVYEREIAVYTQVLPAFERLYESVGIFERIAPRYSLLDTNKFLIAIHCDLLQLFATSF